jgi:hypothetical protein
VFWRDGSGRYDPGGLDGFLGATAVRPVYAVPAPELAGVDQINVISPGHAQRVFPAHSDPRWLAQQRRLHHERHRREASACEPELALAPDALELLDAGGAVPITVFQVVRNPATPEAVDGGCVGQPL